MLVLAARDYFADHRSRLPKEILEQEKLKYFNKNANLVYKSFETAEYSFVYNDGYEITVKEVNNFYAVSKTIREYFDDNNNWIIERNIYFTDETALPNLYAQRLYKTIEDAKNKINEIYTINSKKNRFN